MTKFSIPYNGILKPEAYVKALKPYLDVVESVYFSLPSILPSQQDLNYSQVGMPLRKSGDEVREIVDGNCRILMRLLKKLPVKSVLALNSLAYDISPYERKLLITRDILPLMKKGLLDGAIVCDLALAVDLHAYAPDLELQISCNAGITAPRFMDLWNRMTDAEIFNPVRNACREFDMLRELHETGFKIKVIVNDYCLYSCIQYQADPICDAFHKQVGNFVKICDIAKLHDIFKMNFILPRNLPLIEPYVDIFKIVGRKSSIEDIFYRLDAYANHRDDVDLLRLLPGNIPRKIHLTYVHNVTIPVSEIPDKILRCQCRCGQICKEEDSCKTLLTKILGKQGLRYA